MARFLTSSELYDREGGRDRLAGLTRQSERTKVQDAIESARDRAEAEAVSWLSARYGSDLPATTGTMPAVLKDYVAARTTYHLATVANDEVHPTIIKRADDAARWFAAVARGVASLDISPAVDTDATQAQVLVSRAKADAPMTREALADWWS